MALCRFAIPNNKENQRLIAITKGPTDVGLGFCGLCGARSKIWGATPLAVPPFSSRISQLRHRIVPFIPQLEEDHLPAAQVRRQQTAKASVGSRPLTSLIACLSAASKNVTMEVKCTATFCEKKLSPEGGKDHSSARILMQQSCKICLLFFLSDNCKGQDNCSKSDEKLPRKACLTCCDSLTLVSILGTGVQFWCSPIFSLGLLWN